MTRGKRSVFLTKVAFLYFFVFASSVFTDDSYTLKIGTLAPENSSWIQSINDISDRVYQKTQGKIRIIIYAGGVMGDEEEMIRKIRMGQLQGGGFTINGIKKIAPELEVLDLPFMFKDEKEVDYIYEKFLDEFEKYFEQRGFKLLLFTEQGFTYFYSTYDKVGGYKDLYGRKMWVWIGEENTERIGKVLGCKLVKLKVHDVFSAIEAGMVEVFQTSPMACLSLQWCKLAKIMINYPHRFEPGVVIISKKYFDSLPGDSKVVLQDEFRKSRADFTMMVREGQKIALEKLKFLGIKFVEPKDKDWFEYEIKAKLWSSFENSDLLKKIKDSLETLRKEQNKEVDIYVVPEKN